MRKFDTGATRDTDEGKDDLEGFVSPLVLKKFAAYMTKHRVQADGELRSSDNWQKGIPLDAYMKSLLRHVHDLWLHHRGHPNEARESLDEALGAILFNAQGYWLESTKVRLSTDFPFPAFTEEQEFWDERAKETEGL